MEHANYMVQNHGTDAMVGLPFNSQPAKGSGYKALSVIIPIAVWRQIAGTADPGSFKGKVIEVQTTPQIAGGKYVNMRISAATQLRVLAAP